VFIPIDETLQAIRKENMYLFMGMSGFTAFIFLTFFLLSREIIFKPIREIKHATARIRERAFDGELGTEGDELKEFSGLCYLIDEKLRTQHNELEQRIHETSNDLSHTNHELEKANRELTKLNDAKSEFFTDISHELRTPLTSIKGAADFLSRQSGTTDRTYLNIITKNTNHLITTVVDFLDYSKLETGHLDLEMSYGSLRQVMNDVIRSQVGTANEKNVKLQLRLAGDIMLDMDERRIFQVMTNLLANAVRFSPETGIVEIRADRSGNFAEITVADQGPGIPREYHEAIFEKFYQAPGDKVNSKLNKGASGIGLAICKGLVETHGGAIRVDSDSGRGSAFIFTLPINAS